MASTRLLTTMVLAGLALSNCGSEPEGLDAVAEQAVPVADFSFVIQRACNSPAMEVSFINASRNSDSYRWDFGDGTTSNEISPSKTYYNSGDFQVTLTSRRGAASSLLQKELAIADNDGTGPMIALSYKRADNNSLQIEYSISADGYEYLLHFGDGGTIISSEAIIRHTYSGLGLFEASLIAENDHGRSCESILIDLHP